MGPAGRGRAAKGPGARLSEVAVDLSAVADTDQDQHQPLLFDLVDDAIVTHADAEENLF